MKSLIKKRIKKDIGVNGGIRVLIVVAAGDKSYHINWKYKTEIDILVIYYGDSKEMYNKYKKKADYIIEMKGAKWEMISNIINNNMIDFNNYDYVWFPDDDLDMSDTMIDNMIYYANKYELFLSQPSLEDNGNITNAYNYLLRNEKNQAILKYTNFVEIMCPLMSKRCFNLLKYTLMDTEIKCGWGLDDVWGDIIIKKYKYYNKIAIINDVIIIHTKPPSKPEEGFYSILKIDPLAEMRKTLLKYNIKRVDKVIYNRF